ncbi:class I lanthipeptide [Chitinophaga sp. HK235]|uniref:class I lanthipeptide n=1 Tax=Chitinophaga sp. HK235 TaxID=2952571 RepID=UPI001BAD4048|nr:class I lanthipeptide [Chitinophaga sp. HK235]
MKKQTFKKLSLRKMEIASLSPEGQKNLWGGTGTGPAGPPTIGGGYTTAPTGPMPPVGSPCLISNGSPCQISNGNVGPCCPI